MFEDLLKVYSKVIEMEGAKLRYSGEVLCLAPLDDKEGEFMTPFKCKFNLKVKKYTQINMKLAQESGKILFTLNQMIAFNESLELNYIQVRNYLVIFITDSVGNRFRKVVKIFSKYHGPFTGKVDEELNDNYPSQNKGG